MRDWARTLLVVVASTIAIGSIAFWLVMRSFASALEEDDPRPGYPAITTRLTINTRPRGATVYVDGNNWGTSPVTIAAATIGARLEIKAELAGHVTTTAYVTVVDHGPTVELVLPAKP